MELIKSKRFMVLVVTLVVLLLVAYAPEFASVETDLITVIGALAGLLIFGYSVEDWAQVIAAARRIAAITPTKWDDQLVEGVAAVGQGMATGEIKLDVSGLDGLQDLVVRLDKLLQKNDPVAMVEGALKDMLAQDQAQPPGGAIKHI